MIEGDIQGILDNVDHHKLEKLLRQYANPDQMMINLYWKMVRAGYIEGGGKEYNPRTGIRGILTPLLANLYLTPFDEYMEQLAREFNILPVRKPEPEPEPESSCKEMSQKPWTIRQGRKMSYVRYADD